MILSKTGIFKKIQKALDLPGLIPEKTLMDYVGFYHKRADSYRRLQEKYGTPFFVLDEDAFKRNARGFVDAFSDVFDEFKAYLAVKCNNHPALAAIAVNLGLGLDASSGPELQMAVAGGCGDILFSGPGKTDAELMLAVDHHDIVTILIDSFGELLRLEKIAREKGRVLKCGVRLCTEEKGLWKKFGIGLSSLPSFMSESDACNHVRICGIQFHTSWNRNPGRQTRFIARLGKQLGQMNRRHLAAIRFIDIGGGYWPQRGEWLQPQALSLGRLLTPGGIGRKTVKRHYRMASNPINVFTKSISTAVSEHIFPHVVCAIKAEPGRWICDDAMHILLTVVDKKATDAVITDGGINMIGWERFETDYAPIINLCRPSKKERKCHVFGSLCTPHDIWGTEYFGDGIEPGDLLLIPGQGAYTYSLRQEFIKPLPTVISPCP